MRLTTFIYPTIMLVSFILIFLGLILVALVLAAPTTLPYLTTTGAGLVATAATVAITAVFTASLVSRLNLHAKGVTGLGGLTDLRHQAADIIKLVGG